MTAANQRRDKSPLLDWALLEARVQGASASGDPTALLREEHDWLRDSLPRLARCLRDDARDARCASALHQLARFVERHVEREEGIYFPAVEAVLGPAGRNATEEMIGEHDGINVRRALLLRALAEADDLETAFLHLTRALTIHFGNEEALIFEEMATHLSLEQGRVLAAALHAADAEPPEGQEGGQE